MIDAWLNLADGWIVGIVAAGYGLSALAVSWLSFSAWTRPAALSFQGVVGPFFVSTGTLFALMAAFLGSSVHESARAGANAVMMEREGAIQVMDLALAMPDRKHTEKLIGLTNSYIRTVVDTEWHMPPDRLSAPEADAAYRRLLDAIADTDIWTSAKPPLQRALLDAAQEISSGRLARLSVRGKQVDEIAWIGVLILGLLAQWSVGAVHLDRRRPQALALALTTTAIVTALSVVALTERPFSGWLSLSPQPLAQLLDRVKP